MESHLRFEQWDQFKRRLTLLFTSQITENMENGSESQSKQASSETPKDSEEDYHYDDFECDR